MVRRDILTQKDIFDAASQLRAMGKQVTALKILAMLGGGSLTTIYKYLDQWEAMNRTAEFTADSDEIPAAVMNAFRSVWRLTVSEAEKQCVPTEKDSQIRQLSEKLSIVQEERDKAVQREAHLLGQIDALKSANERLLSRLGKKGS